ncbi:MAG: ComEC/Rec2 family competence protein [Actinomycetota bacterium]
MGVVLLPAAAGAFTLGLLAWPILGGAVPEWGWLLLGAAGLIGAAVGASGPRSFDEIDLSGRIGAERPRGSDAIAALEALAPGRVTKPGVTALALAGLILFGVGWAGLWEARLDDGVLAGAAPSSGRLEAALRTDPTLGPYGWSALADVGSFDGGEGVVGVRERAWISGRGDPPAGVVRGDRVVIEGSIEVPDDPGFRMSLRRRGIGVLVTVDELERIGPSANTFVRAAQGVRAATSRALLALFPPREAGLLMGLALGDGANLDPALERDFDAAGLGHLLVASGGNVAMVLVPALWLASLLRLPRTVRFAGGVALVAAVVLVTGGEPSVLRAGVMAGLALLGVASGRPRATGALVAGAVLVLLVLDPWLVWSVGFQLSVAATAGLAALAAPLADRLSWLPRPAALAVGTTIAAQLGVTPLLLFHFREVPGTTILANLAAFPLVAPSMLLGLGAAAAGAVLEPLGRLLAGMALVPVRGLEVVADRAAKAPVPALASGGGIGVLLAGTALVAAIVWRLRTQRPFPRIVPIAAAAIVPVLAWWVALGAGPPGGLEVRVFDVGQGDAALVSSPGGARILIDGGPDPDEVAGELAALGVRRLDLVVASHPHADHIVGLPAVLARFPVGTVLEPGCPDEWGALRPELLRAISEERVPLQHPRTGASYRVGDLTVEVLSPAECFTSTESDLNNDALVLRIRWGDRTVLFATEPEEPAQEAMLDAGLDLRADVLKVPHHGGGTSVPEFFEAVAPSIAVVSVGENPYGHPVGWVLDELEATGAQVVRTDQHGDVVLTLGPGGVGLA